MSRQEGVDDVERGGREKERARKGKTEGARLTRYSSKGERERKRVE